jgi:hypothetical protein
MTIKGNLTGYITKDAELKTVADQTVCSFTIASNTSKLNPATGKWEDVAEFHQVTIWNENRAKGAYAKLQLNAGRHVEVTGTVRGWGVLTDEHDANGVAIIKTFLSLSISSVKDEIKVLGWSEKAMIARYAARQGRGEVASQDVAAIMVDVGAEAVEAL